MNRKRFICGIIAAAMLMPTVAYADGTVGKVKGQISSETKTIGSNTSGATYDELTDKKDLTMEDATTNAIAFSRDIKNLDDSIDVAEDNQIAVRENFQNAGAEDAMGNIMISGDYQTTHSLAVV